MEKGFSIEDLEKLIMEMNIDNPRNNVFTPDDFESYFIEGLRKDHLLLKELIKEWENIQEDPKLDAFLKVLKSELLGSSINPTGQLVIFTESTDTANYLQEKVEEHLGTKVLNISSDNRSKLFETVQENFDANYIGERKDDFKILITTDVLAEGVNLHRCNVIVNYDTPWNATRLMQRIGRVNRIGSVAGVIYNYNFYPSQQGDDEIRLYSNALVKLQGFHTAFGEDAQIYTHEEMLEQFELFKEGLKDDEDKRLQFLRFIREFKDENPKEFKRIKQFPMKARTARKLENILKENSREGTVVFLKSPYKMEFYQVDTGNKVNAISFLEAAQYFEANASEPGFEIPAQHYTQVEAALNTFDQDFLGSSTETAASTDKADMNTKSALKFLRDFKAITHQQEVKEACKNLYKLVEDGTYTPLANELRRLNQRYFGAKKDLTTSQTDNLVKLYAKKYDAFVSDDDEKPEINNEIDTSISPDIVLSETFLQ